MGPQNPKIFRAPAARENMIFGRFGRKKSKKFRAFGAKFSDFSGSPILNPPLPWGPPREGGGLRVRGGLRVGYTLIVPPLVGMVGGLGELALTAARHLPLFGYDCVCSC